MSDLTTTSMSAGQDANRPADLPSGRAARRFPTGWVALGIALGLLLGLGAGLLVVPALSRPADTSAEAGFVRDMSSHHAQAVEMSMIAHQRGSDFDVRALGADIGLTQHGQIGMMQAWLRDWGLDPTGSQPAMAWMPGGAAAVRDGLMPGMAKPAEMTALRAATGRDVDVQYLRLMQQHHVGGIHMARAIVDQSDHEDVTWLAQTMVNGQQKELEVIQSLLTKLGATP